jgi:hypothetical protein
MRIKTIGPCPLNETRVRDMFSKKKRSIISKAK